MKVCFDDGGLALKIPVIIAHTFGCCYIHFHDMLKWLTYVSLWLSTQILFRQDMPKKSSTKSCYKASIGIDLLLTTPAHLPQEISSAALSDTPCKAKFSLRLSRPIVARSCLPPVDEESSRSFWVLGSRRRISTHF